MIHIYIYEYKLVLHCAEDLSLGANCIRVAEQKRRIKGQAKMLYTLHPTGSTHVLHLSLIRSPSS